MIRVILLVLMVGFLASGSLAQNIDTAQRVSGEREASLSLGDGSGPRYGSASWENMAGSPYFCVAHTDYIFLDWGVLRDQGNGLDDEVIDGFRFNYATNDDDPSGLSWAIYFYDSCTGWGDYSLIPESGIHFQGLPNAYGLPPGNWGWNISVNLEGSGYEFLLGEEIGVGHVLAENIAPAVAGPGLGKPPLIGGNGDTGTEDVFSQYYPNGNLKGTFWYGGYPAHPYSTWRVELRGASDPAQNTSYAGIGLQGNITNLYTIGSWTNGGQVRFLLRKNGMPQSGAVLANTSYNWPPLYLPAHDVTLVPTMPFLAALHMIPDYIGDFDSYTLTVGPAIENMKIYMQGGISDYFSGGPVPPIDLSQAVVSN